MASNLVLHSGSKMIGSPVVFEVTAGTLAAGATFHRVRVVLTVGGSEFEFSQPAANGEKLYFDISSAFCALADMFEYTASGTNPVSGGYPSYGNASGDNIKAYDDYLIDGVEHRGEGGVTGTLAGPYYQGYLTDRERLTNERPTFWSRKPSYMKSREYLPEIVFFGMEYLTPNPFDQRPSVTVATVAGEWNKTSNKSYAIECPVDAYELRFINSLGIHESLHITCLRQTEVNIKNTFYTKAVMETLTKFSRGVSVKKNDYEQWRMSSGPLDRAWQQYYLHEPLMAKWAWLKVDGQWLPVHIVPEETTKGVDRSKGNALTVEFTLRFDINGSPFA